MIDVTKMSRKFNISKNVNITLKIRKYIKNRLKRTAIDTFEKIHIINVKM
jgi:ribosome-associated translation inhibitor RaiA